MTTTAPPAALHQPDLGGVDPEVYGRRWAILGVLCLSLVLVVAAVSSVNTAIPSIRLQLLPTDAQLLWIVDIYAVVFAGLLLPAGALGDRFGRKSALQFGLITFAVGSVLSSQAGSPANLLAFRCIMGLGAAFIMPSTLSLLTSVFPPAERPKAIAVWTGFAGAGGVIGTLMSGLVLSHYWWGSVFFVSVPITLLAVLLVSVMCPSSKEEHVTPLDPIGAALSVLGFGSLLYGIIEGPEKGWTSVHSIAAFALAIVGLVGFVLWERQRMNPMLDVRFFGIPRFGAGALGVTFTFFAMFSMFFLIAQFLQSVRGYSPLKAGVCTLPFAITMVAVSPRGATLAAKFGPRRVILSGLSVIPVGLVMLSQRLYPDMFALTRQVQIATDGAKAAGARLAGIAVPSFPDEEKTFEDLQARVAKTMDFLSSLTKSQFEGAADRVITFKSGGNDKSFKGSDYIGLWAFPNFFFHIATAYNILRHNGLEIGKGDYLRGG